MPALDQAAIEQLIPHRPPFLWLDSVSELSESAITAHKTIPADLDVFAGHYPHFPVLPGVLVCEAVFQAGAVLIAHSQTFAAGTVPVVTRQNNTQFRQMVRPGDTLDISVELTERLANAFFLKGKAAVNGKTAVRLEFACAAAEVDSNSAS